MLICLPLLKILYLTLDKKLVKIVLNMVPGGGERLGPGMSRVFVEFFKEKKKEKSEMTFRYEGSDFDQQLHKTEIYLCRDVTPFLRTLKLQFIEV